jgi:hypothetical protein
MWAGGRALLVVGGLSFVLPIFDRQFILVTLLGLTGAGSAAVGLILMAIGIVLLNKGRAHEREQELAMRAHFQRRAAEAEAERQTELANHAEFQAWLREKNAKARTVDPDHAFTEIINLRSSGVQLPQAIGQAIPEISPVHVADVCAEIKHLQSLGTAEDEAIRAAVKNYLMKI